MKNKLKYFISITAFFSFVFSQISLDDINNINNAQLDLIKDQLKTPQEVSNIDTEVDIQTTSPDIVTIQASENELSNQLNNNQNNQNQNFESVDFEKNKFYDEYFGYDYFLRPVDFFDNASPSSDYVLGAGDEIVLSLWGEHNLQKNFLISKTGLIYYDSIGYINLSGKTLVQSEEIMIEKLSKIYSTLNDGSNSTKLMLEIGKLKSINVYFTGNVNNPGVHLIHPFSDIFLALSQSGGVAKNGSLRKIQLIRSNKVIETIDLYEFFKSGTSSFTKIKLIDGYVIHVPGFISRVKVEGPFNSSKIYFELKEKENIMDLLTFADGLKPNATSFFIVSSVIPIEKRVSDDFSQSTKLVYYKDIDNHNLINGDIVKVNDIGETQTTVEVLGRTKIRGYFPAHNATLKQVLNLAGGFNDPVYLKSINLEQIIVLRKDKENLYGEEFIIKYEDSESFGLMPDDKIFVYENSNYDNAPTVRIEGQVLNKGTYPLRDNMTLKDLVNLSGGFLPNASFENVSVVVEDVEVDSLGGVTTSNIPIYNIDQNFKLTENAVVTVLPAYNIVKVEGNVYNPGLVVYDKGMSLSNAIELAGGFMPFSLKNKVYIRSASGKITKPKFLNGRFKLLNPGDTVVVPQDPNPENFDITTFISDLSSTLANIAAIIVIVNSN
ncbi:MAG: SLBB domain-containing protein [Candidatus Neomarinimicrobiota bacterium]